MADRNLFFINITDDASNEIPDATPFVTKQVPEEIWEESGQAWAEHLCYMTKKSSAISMCYTAAFISFAVMGCMIWEVLDPMINAETKWTLAQSLTSRPIYPIMGGVALLLTIVMGCIIHHKNKVYQNDPTRQALAQKVQDIATQIDEILNSPEDALSIDIMPTYYSVAEDGTWREELNTDNTYMNKAVSLWYQDGYVCMCDDHVVMSIPCDAFEGYYTVDAQIVITDWHKEDEPSHQKFKAFGVKEAGRDGYLVDTYYDIVISHGEDTFDLLVPSYDFSLITDMVALPCLDQADV